MRSNGTAATLLAKAHAFGFRAFLRPLMRGRLLVLCYHGVVPDEDLSDPLAYGNVIGVSNFAQQMSELSRRFHPIAASDLAKWRIGSGDIPHNPVLVTFDDGYRNNLTVAAPILRRYGVPGLINIATGYIGRQRILWPDEVYLRVLFWPCGSLPMPAVRSEVRVPSAGTARRALASKVREGCKRLPEPALADYLSILRQETPPRVSHEVSGFLSWDDVRSLKRQGFEIGSHTVEHPILAHLDDERLDAELGSSKDDIERELGCPCPYFAYPNGGSLDVSSAVVQAVRRAGYSYAFTVMGRLAVPNDNPLALDRVYVPGDAVIASFLLRSSGLPALWKRPATL